MWLAQRLSLPLSCLCFSLLASLTSDAAMRRIPLGRLVANAESIYEVTVTELTTRMSPELGVIVTDARLEVHDVLKGDATSTAVVTLLGGQLGLETHSFSNEPELEVGERAIVFVVTRPWGLAISGRFQGVYRIDGDSIVQPASLARASLDRFRTAVHDFVRRGR